MNDKLYEKINNYTKYKLVEMLIEKHKDCKLNNLNKIEEITDDVLNTLSLCGLKFYGEMSDVFQEKE